MQKNDLISTLIEKYRNLSNIHDKSYKFIFKNKELDENLSVEESGIMNNSNIIVSEQICILFRSNLSKNLITIYCRKDEMISTLIERYRNITQVRYNLTFIYNAEELNEEYTVGKTELLNGSSIFFIYLK